MSKFHDAQQTMLKHLDGRADVHSLSKQARDEVRSAAKTLNWWKQEDWPRPHIAEPARSVAIVGKGPFASLAPWGQPGWEFWGLNDAVYDDGWPPLEAHTRWFQLHNPEYLRVHYPRGLRELEGVWGVERGLVLYMDRHYAEYPESVAYPKESVEALVPQFGPYHASSFDWMVALAIYEGFEQIALSGVEFGAFPYTAGEPISGRACLEFWMGVAAGRGIVIECGPQQGGDLFMTTHMARYRSYLQYGFEREPALDMKNDGWDDVR